jgi:hypothetical protein
MSTFGDHMKSERDKMLASELSDGCRAGRRAGCARDLCQALNAAREAEQDERRAIVRELFGAGRDTVWMQPPFFCDYGANIRLGERVFFRRSEHAPNKEEESAAADLLQPRRKPSRVIALWMAPPQVAAPPAAATATVLAPARHLSEIERGRAALRR